MKYDDTLEELFDQAISLSSESEREDYLKKACAGNPSLMAEVVGMLKMHEQDARLNDPSRTTDPHLTPLEEPGTQLGPYKLLQRIGEGGMGVVYMAKQTTPIDRRVVG